MVDDDSFGGNDVRCSGWVTDDEGHIADREKFGFEGGTFFDNGSFGIVTDLEGITAAVEGENALFDISNGPGVTDKTVAVRFRVQNFLGLLAVVFGFLKDVFVGFFDDSLTIGGNGYVGWISGSEIR